MTSSSSPHTEADARIIATAVACWIDHSRRPPNDRRKKRGDRAHAEQVRSTTGCWEQLPENECMRKLGAGWGWNKGCGPDEPRRAMAVQQLHAEQIGQ